MDPPRFKAYGWHRFLPPGPMDANPSLPTRRDNSFQDDHAKLGVRTKPTAMERDRDGLTERLNCLQPGHK